MAKQVLNVGTHNNDKTGDTLRAGGLKIKANFDEIYGALASDGTNITGGNLLKTGSWSDIRNKPDFKALATTADFFDILNRPALVTATAKPSVLIGYEGQEAGQIAFDGNNLYVSTADYDGETQIWKYVPWGGSGTTQGYSYTHNQDPTINGGFSLNNENPALANVAYISINDINGNNIHPFYQYIFDNNLNFLLEVISATNPQNRALFKVTGSHEMEANNMEYYGLDLVPILSTNEMTISDGVWDLHFDFTGGLPTHISSGNSAPGSAVVATSASVDVNFAMMGTRFKFKDNGELQLGSDGDIVDSNGKSLLGSNVTVPTTSLGNNTHKAGMTAADSTYFYYCTADHDGFTNIWKRVQWESGTW